MPQEAPRTPLRGQGPAVLTAYQRRVLWLLSQGNTVSEAAQVIGTARQSVTDAALYGRRKLNARTNEQAVLRAYLDGHIGPYADCGSREAYLRHRARDEDACPACKRANREWLEGLDTRPREPVPLTEPQIRLIRAFHVGRTQQQIRILWSLSRGQMERLVTDMYRRLGVSGVPRELRRERALQAAMDRGYLSPDVVRLPCPELPEQGKRLSPTEVKVLAAVDGRTLSKAAGILGMERTTVSSHLNRAYTKLGVGHLPRNDKRPVALRKARGLGYLV